MKYGLLLFLCFLSRTATDPPRILGEPTIQPKNAKVGDEVKIYCRAKGTPKPTFKFKKGKNTLSSNKNQEVDEKNGILTLKSITIDSEAVYTCIATNKGGKVKSTTMLDVKVPPVIKPIDNVGIKNEKESTDIKCTATGDPPLRLIWKKRGKAAISNTDNGEGPYTIDEASSEPVNAKIKTASKILRFSSIRPSDIGEYMCKAINNVGTANVTIDFVVLYAPRFDTNYKRTEFYGSWNDTANLTCMVSANPLATFKWYIPNEDNPENVSKATQLDNTGPYSIMSTQKFPDFQLSSSSLLVNLSDDESLFRDYMCEASNGQQAVRTVTLKEGSPPAQPMLKLVATHSTWVSVEVTKPSINGGFPVTYYSYKYYASNDSTNVQEGVVDGDDVSGNKTEFSIKSLKPITSYVVEVSAGNVAGSGAFSQLFFETKKAGPPFIMTISSPESGSEARSYTLTWAQPEANGSPIIAYHITWQKVSIAGDTTPEWSVAEYVAGTKVEKTITDNLDRFNFTITGLVCESYYNVEIKAENEVGESVPAVKIIKTSAGGKECEAEETSTTNLLGVGIAIGALIVIALAVLAYKFGSMKTASVAGPDESGGISGMDADEKFGTKKKSTLVAHSYGSPSRASGLTDAKTFKKVIGSPVDYNPGTEV